ncbi:uncharacterized protein [Dysidea avara]|uniref:uncharacterized protein isoform X1 n=1 Tax=Dysidea avara TaxID=196820 RepID=UPI00331AADFD
MEHGDTPTRLQSRKRICRPSREESLPKRSCHSSTESSTGWLFDECDLASDDSYCEEWDTALMEGNHSEPLVMPIEPEAMSSSSFVAAYNDQLLLSRALDESSVPRSTSLPPVIPPVTTTCIEQKEFLQSIIDSIAGKFPELVFTLRYNGLDSTNPVLEISQRAVFNHPPLGLTPRVCVTIQNKHYKVHVMMRPWSEGEIKSINDVEELCDLFCRRSLYKFCPGIDPVHYENQYHKTIRFHIKSVRQSEFPFSRVDSVNCKLWFLPASNCKVAEKDASEMKCPPCKRLVHDLNLQRKRTLEESPSRRIKRQCPSSRARLQYMSPASKQTRKRYAQYQRSSNIRNLRRLEDSEVVLSDEQNVEMCAVMEATQAEDLDKLYQEGDQHGVGSLMKTLWLTDKDRQQKQFFSDQEKNTNGGRGNRWNMITIRMALAIYTRSPAAYKALQSFDILKLPSKSTMQAFTGAFMHAPGASNVCIIKQVA